MQKNKNEIYVFVQTDMLLQEKLFELLRKCILNLDLKDVECYDTFYYDINKNEIVQKHILHHSYLTDLSWVTRKMKKGNIFISLSILEKLLSL